MPMKQAKRRTTRTPKETSSWVRMDRGEREVNAEDEQSPVGPNENGRKAHPPKTKEDR